MSIFYLFFVTSLGKDITCCLAVAYLYAVYIRVARLQSLYNAFCAVYDFSFGQGYDSSKGTVSPCGTLLVFINKIAGTGF